MPRSNICSLAVGVPIVFDVSTVIIDISTVIIDISTAIIDISTVIIDISTFIIDISTVIVLLSSSWHEWHYKYVGKRLLTNTMLGLRSTFSNNIDNHIVNILSILRFNNNSNCTTNIIYNKCISC